MLHKVLHPVAKPLALVYHIYMAFTTENRKTISLIAVLLSISLLQMSGMNISPALQTLHTVFPEQSSESIQTLVTLPSLFMVFASFLAVPCAKYFSKKRTILFGSLCFSISGLIPMVFSSFAALRLSRMMIGASLGLFIPINTTLLFAFFTDPDQRNTIIGWQSCASATGNVIATTLAGVLVQINYKLTFLVHLIGLLTFFLNLFLLPQDETGRREEKKEGEAPLLRKLSGVINRRSVSWLLVSFTYMSYLNCFSTKISLLVESQNIGTSSVSALGISLLTVGSFAGGLCYGQISKILKGLTLPVGLFVSSAGILSLGLAHSVFPVYLSGILAGLGLSMEAPVVVVGLLGEANPDDRILLTAMSSAMSNLGLSMSPYISAFTTSLIIGRDKTLRDEYIVCACVLMIMCIGAFVRFLIMRKRKNKGIVDSV